jgi:hypothetical protein
VVRVRVQGVGVLGGVGWWEEVFAKVADSVCKKRYKPRISTTSCRNKV